MKTRTVNHIWIARKSFLKPNSKDSCTSENHLQRAVVSWLFLHLSREVLSGLRECFRGKESRRSHCAGQEGISPLKLVTDSEVCYLDVSILSHQQVRGFDVSVDDPLVMYCWNRTINRKLLQQQHPIWGILLMAEDDKCSLTVQPSLDWEGRGLKITFSPSEYLNF